MLPIVTLVRLARIERIAPDADDAVADRNAGQAGAVIERTVPDMGDSTWDPHARQGCVLERSGPDGTDGQVFNRVRYEHGAAGARVPDDGDCPPAATCQERVGDAGE